MVSKRQTTDNVANTNEAMNNSYLNGNPCLLRNRFYEVFMKGDCCV